MIVMKSAGAVKHAPDSFNCYKSLSPMFLISKNFNRFQPCTTSMFTDKFEILEFLHPCITLCINAAFLIVHKKSLA